MTLPIKEAETKELMDETQSLHDLIYNIKCYGPQDMARLESLYAEIEHRGIAVVEQSAVMFVESPISTN